MKINVPLTLGLDNYGTVKDYCCVVAPCFVISMSYLGVGCKGDSDTCMYGLD